MSLEPEYRIDHEYDFINDVYLENSKMYLVCKEAMAIFDLIQM